MTEECGMYAITILIICIQSLAVTIMCTYSINIAFAREKDTILGAYD